METLESDKQNSEHTVDEIRKQNQLLQSRIDELEDRSRRDNIILHGISDDVETWAETEEKVLKSLAPCLGHPSPPLDIVRAHRLGKFSVSRCRPVIVKFSSYKTKEKILQSASKLKEVNVRVTEDFSPATRLARKRLTDFAKQQPASPRYRLKYKKLFIASKCYMYDSVADNVYEVVTTTAQLQANSASPPRPAPITEVSSD